MRKYSLIGLALLLIVVGTRLAKTHVLRQSAYGERAFFPSWWFQDDAAKGTLTFAPSPGLDGQAERMLHPFVLTRALERRRLPLTAETLREAIRIERVGDMLEVAVEHTNPELATNACDSLLEEYAERHRELDPVELAGRIALLETHMMTVPEVSEERRQLGIELGHLKRALDEARLELRGFARCRHPRIHR